MPPKTRTLYLCDKCDAQFLGWQGRCTECGTWGSVREGQKKTVPEKMTTADISSLQLVSLNSLPNQDAPRLSTHMPELDTVLGGGIVAGSLILLGGDPGIGKSTLALQMLASIAGPNPLISTDKSGLSGFHLYVCAEESPSQIKLRADRLPQNTSHIRLLPSFHLEHIITCIETLKPELVVIDSIQMMRSEEIPTEAGEINQIKICAVKLLETAKKTNIPIIIIGHVTKDGLLAGPKSMEHLVDVVLSLEGEKDTRFRVLRGNKNRFGNTDEIGVFEMNADGFHEIANPSIFFLQQKHPTIPGSAISTTILGNKIFFLEVQALLSPTSFGYPVRKASGFDLNRLTVLAAVMSNRLKIPLAKNDLYLNVVGGMKASDPGLDLAVCWAILSAYKQKKCLNNSVAFGEVGLGGEVRAVPSLEKRFKEAQKLGFQKILIPKSDKHSTPVAEKNLTLFPVGHISELLDYLD